MSIGTIWTYRDVIKREQGVEAAIEFEQVVKKYQAEQIGYERERIIKLLEDSEVRAKWIEATSKSLPTYQGVVDFFTSLIKGEQK